MSGPPDGPYELCQPPVRWRWTALF